VPLKRVNHSVEFSVNLQNHCRATSAIFIFNRLNAPTLAGVFVCFHFAICGRGCLRFAQQRERFLPISKVNTALAFALREGVQMQEPLRITQHEREMLIGQIMTMTGSDSSIRQRLEALPSDELRICWRQLRDVCDRKQPGLESGGQVL
jgi:hypothetical protein